MDCQLPLTNELRRTMGEIRYSFLVLQPMRFEADMYYIIKVANTELHLLAIQVVTGADNLSG